MDKPARTRAMARHMHCSCKRPAARPVLILYSPKERIMKALTIMDLSTSIDLDREAMAEVHGGRMKLIGQHANGAILTSADGDPVGVYVDGVLQNSVGDGYYHL
jgi:hypothetical protein